MTYARSVVSGECLVNTDIDELVDLHPCFQFEETADLACKTDGRFWWESAL